MNKNKFITKVLQPGFWFVSIYAYQKLSFFYHIAICVFYNDSSLCSKSVNEHVSKWHIVTTVVLNVKDNYRPNPVYTLIGVMAIAVLAIILNYYNSL
jgi:hypothetical protein